MIQVRINDTKIDVPQSWNEMRLAVQLMCYKILHGSIKTDLLEPIELMPMLRLELMKVLIGKNHNFMLAWEQDCIKANPEGGKDDFIAEVHEMCTITDFLFDLVDEEKKLYAISPTLTKNSWPQITGEGKQFNRKKKIKYFGPKDELSNISLYELAQTFTDYEKYVKSKDEKHLHKLLAILYRPAKRYTKPNADTAYDGDIRLPFVGYESTVDRRAKQMSYLPDLSKKLMLFWFASCRIKIINSYPNVFKTAYEYEKSSNLNKYGWAGVIWNLAGGITNTEEVCSKNHTEALAYLSYLEDQRIESEKKD